MLVSYSCRSQLWVLPRCIHKEFTRMTSSRPALPPEAAAAQLLFQIATGHFAASALQVVAKLRLADQLATGSQSTAALAQHFSVHEDALYRVLRALASIG